MPPQERNRLLRIVGAIPAVERHRHRDGTGPLHRVAEEEVHGIGNQHLSGITSSGCSAQR